MTRASSGKKSKQNRKAPSPPVMVRQLPAPTRSRRAVLWMLRPTRLIPMALIAVVWMVSPLLLRLLPRLDSRPEYLVSVSSVTLNTPPAWIPEHLVEQVFERAGMEGSVSLLDETLSERVAAAFHTHPWIQSVRSVRKSFPARLHVEVVFREPVAMVKGVDGFYPIDRHSILLPPSDFTLEDTQRFPVIERVSSVPLGRLGQPWGDPAVLGAAELAGALLQSPDGQQSWWVRLELQSILVPRRVAFAEDLDQLEFQIRTRGGSEIFWGRTPATRHPGELTVAQKLQRLSDYHRDYGGFDDSHGPWEIDIRPWHGIGRALLARDPERAGALR